MKIFHKTAISRRFLKISAEEREESPMKGVLLDKSEDTAFEIQIS